MAKQTLKTSAKPTTKQDVDTSALCLALVADVTNGATVVTEIRKALGLKAGQFAPAEGTKAYEDYAARLETVTRDTKAVYVWETLRKSWRTPNFDDETKARAVGVLRKKGKDRTGAEVTAEKRARQRWNDWRAKAGLDPIDNRGGANNVAGKGGKRDKAEGVTPKGAAEIIKADAPDAPVPVPLSADQALDQMLAFATTAQQYAGKHADVLPLAAKEAAIAFFKAVSFVKASRESEAPATPCKPEPVALPEHDRIGPCDARGKPRKTRGE